MIELLGKPLTFGDVEQIKFLRKEEIKAEFKELPICAFCKGTTGDCPDCNDGTMECGECGQDTECELCQGTGGTYCGKCDGTGKDRAAYTEFKERHPNFQYLEQ